MKDIFLFNIFDHCCTPFNDPDSAVECVLRVCPDLSKEYDKNYIECAFMDWSKSEIDELSQNK